MSLFASICKSCLRLSLRFSVSGVKRVEIFQRKMSGHLNGSCGGGGDGPGALMSKGVDVSFENGGGGGRRRGALIVLEGCDKAGKSTQCRLLVDALNKQGRKCRLFNFPDRTTEIGKMIDGYLKCTKSLSDEAIHLLFSSNRWELVPMIRNILEEGESIVIDRYAFSGVAFSAAKGTLDLEWCKSPDRGLPQPDRVFFLNLSEEAAALRGDYGTERYEKKEFQGKVKNVFLKIQDDRYWKVIDADKSKEDLHNELYKLSVDCILESEDKPLLQLWKD